MIVETKIAVCCVISLIVGIASVAPIAYLMYQESLPKVDVAAVLGDKAPLNFNLTYAYIGDYWKNNSNINDGNYGWKYTINYHTTSKINLDTFPSNQSYAAYEYYTAEVSSANGVIAILTFDSRVCTMEYLRNNGSDILNFYNQNWFTSNSSNTMYSAANSQQGPATIYNKNCDAYGQIIGSASDWNMTSGKPETITLTIKRLGWVIIDDNNVTVHNANSELIVQVQLKNYSDGFIYNQLFTQEELVKINPVMPQFYKYIQ